MWRQKMWRQNVAPEPARHFHRNQSTIHSDLLWKCIRKKKSGLLHMEIWRKRNKRITARLDTTLFMVDASIKSIAWKNKSSLWQKLHEKVSSKVLRWQIVLMLLQTHLERTHTHAPSPSLPLCSLVHGRQMTRAQLSERGVNAGPFPFFSLVQSISGRLVSIWTESTPFLGKWRTEHFVIGWERCYGIAALPKCELEQGSCKICKSIMILIQQLRKPLRNILLWNKGRCRCHVSACYGGQGCI